MRALYTCIWMLLILLSSRFVQAAEPGNTPEQLIRELSAAASRGDTNAFLAGLTGESRRSIDDWIRANQALKTDRDALREAMDQRFGPGRPIPTSPAPDFATALKKIHSLELIHASPQNPNTIMLSVKTTLDVTGAEITASETTFVAKQENGVWLLELTPGPPINVDAEHRAIVSVLEGVRRGDFHDRGSALFALNQTVLREAGHPQMGQRGMAFHDKHVPPQVPAGPAVSSIGSGRASITVRPSTSIVPR